MNAPQELAVTLSKALYRHLIAESLRLDVSIELLVASMVCDTMQKAETELATTNAVAA